MFSTEKAVYSLYGKLNRLYIFIRTGPALLNCFFSFGILAFADTMAKEMAFFR